MTQNPIPTTTTKTYGSPSVAKVGSGPPKVGKEVGLSDGTALSGSAELGEIDRLSVGVQVGELLIAIMLTISDEIIANSLLTDELILSSMPLTNVSLLSWFSASKVSSMPEISITYSISHAPSIPVSERLLSSSIPITSLRLVDVSAE